LTTTTNYMNFDTFIINTNDNLIFNNNESKNGYIFRINDILRSERSLESDDIVGIWFILKNQQTVYYRKYLKAQEVLASVGGFINFIYILAISINYYFNVYQIILNATNYFKSNKFNFRWRNDISNNQDRHFHPNSSSMFQLASSKNNISKPNSEINLLSNINTKQKIKINSSFGINNNSNKENIINNTNNINNQPFKKSELVKMDHNSVLIHGLETNQKKPAVEKSILYDDILNLPQDSFKFKIIYVIKRAFCCTMREDYILKIRNLVINEKAILNLYLENIKIKSFLEETNEKFLEKKRNEEIFIDDLDHFSMQV
jgi:hypothetical protein